MIAPDTVVTVLVPTAVDERVPPSACGECFGWGFIWSETAPGEPMPGPDCVACLGTGARW
ncbi:hypothetical protein ACFU5O_03020 [Streptomyces sp. NPDC057445]|uniref:hypothetical protein n=1 Tax=Streptomyces sp. NPDC057445 TaxID=3346136 RepID=UPI0036B0C7D8